jgi:hypothetical protein
MTESLIWLHTFNVLFVRKYGRENKERESWLCQKGKENAVPKQKPIKWKFFHDEYEHTFLIGGFYSVLDQFYPIHEEEVLLKRAFLLRLTLLIFNVDF